MKTRGIKISPGEKVGVIGRTGTGKSTLVLSLLRFIEQNTNEVYVDGRDITRMELKELRAKFAVLPQVGIVEEFQKPSCQTFVMRCGY